ncbi:MAG: MotA/TolQ/ExbB proton channel family protein [Alphaproteobacteria bacterium]|nr:MotA/TolQ/ExbB proton channel family protein [Alphaproteobacteria bacterium]
MSSDASTKKSSNKNADTGKLPTIRFAKPYTKADFATILGLTFAIGLIVLAIAMGQSNANFFNVPSLLIVILGTMAATSTSFTGEELARAGQVIAKSIVRRIQKPSTLSVSLIDLALIAKKKGLLALVNYEKELNKDPFLAHSIQMVVDGYNAEEVQRLLKLEIAALSERHKRSASICRRASEIAPAMGLIGTLVGLVQMLADLENPEAIGPAMAVALLTTFYGAILGTVIMAPMAIKLEKNTTDETLIKNLISTATISIARQENPRRLEMLLNSELPPSEQITYFD